MTTLYTQNYGFRKPAFNQRTWADEVNYNFDLLDAIIYDELQTTLVGDWDNSTAYSVGQRAVETDGTIYVCQVAHTSAASGTFEDDRTDNPTYWSLMTDVISPRGAWANSTTYYKNDLAYQTSEGVAAICTATHESNSSGDIRDDSGNWAFLIDLNYSAAASAVSYSNGSSGMTAANVQAAIDELDSVLDALAVTVAAKANKANAALTGSPTAPTQATNDESTRIATTAYVANKIAANPSFRNVTVAAATTANIALSTDLENGDTLDGVTLSTDDLVLVKDQTAASENGIYKVVASGAASRDADYDEWNDLINLIANVPAGTANSNKSFRTTINSGGTIDTTDIDWQTFGTTVATPLAIADGGTNATTEAGARTSLGLGSGNDPTFTSVFMNERASAASDVAGDGQWWVKDDTPNTPMFTDDAGTDHQIARYQDIHGQQTVNLLTSGMITRETNGASAFSEEIAANDTMKRGYAFDASTDQAIQIMFPMPKGYDGSSSIPFKFYWTTDDTAGTGSVVWAVRAKWIRNDDALDGSWGTAVTVTDTFIADDDLHISTEVACTPGGTYADECMLCVELYRDADNGSDTYTEDAVLIAAMMHLTYDAAIDD